MADRQERSAGHGIQFRERGHRTSEMKTKNKAEAPALFRRILVATDGTVPAAWAVERAARLPIAQGGKLIVAQVLPEHDLRGQRKAMKEEAQRYLNEFTHRIQSRYRKARRSDVTVAAALRRGPAYQEIIRVARTMAADLIVLGKHGHSAVRDLLLGSTAEKIIHAGHIPVLIVNRKPAEPYRHPAVALDLEDTARTTLDVALRALGPEVADIAVIHAYAAPFEGAITHREPGAYRRACRADAAKRLGGILKSVDDAIHWETAIRFGDPRTVIVRELARQRADLAVLGTHGRSGLSHFLLGSVAEYVIRSAECDVLLARPLPFSFALP
jgi:universal stress protein E